MMNKIKLCMLVALTGYNLNAQEIPIKIIVPPVSPDVNQQFAILHYEAIAKDKFSIVYLQNINGSIVTANEFMPDTGGAVYTDSNKKEYVQNANNATLLIKQNLGTDGNATTEQVWLLANRNMASTAEYRLYLPKKFNHPVIKSNVPVTLTIHNLDAVKGLSETEFQALVEHVNRILPKDHSQQSYQQSAYKKPTVADDLTRTKEQFKALRSIGQGFRGDLPKGENVLTRYSVLPDRNFVITKGKGDSYLLKFYITEDYKKFDCLDSTRVEGSIDLTSVTSIYDRSGNPIGAVANMLNKTKDAKGEDLLQQITVAMDKEYTIQTWKHSVGKNKLNSLSPELSWYNGDNLMLLSTNNEKFFKPYYQVHAFAKNKEAVLMYPTTEEEKGTEKKIYAKSFQPERPIGTSLPPTAAKDIPVGFSNVRGTQYIFSQGVRTETTTNSPQYLSMDIIRITPEGKLTNIDMFEGYQSNVPVPVIPIIENLDHSYYLVKYMNMLLIRFDKDKSEVSPLNNDKEILDPKMDGEFFVKNNFGSAMMKRSTSGPSRILYFYQDLK